MNAEFISNGNIRKHGSHGARTHVPFVVDFSVDKTALKGLWPHKSIFALSRHGLGWVMHIISAFSLLPGKDEK